MSFAARFTIWHPITAALTRVERARGFLEAAKLSEEWIRRTGERAFVLDPHHTTHIEGTRLTLEQAERLWAGERVPEADPDDVREGEPAEAPAGPQGDGGQGFVHRAGHRTDGPDAALPARGGHPGTGKGAVTSCDMLRQWAVPQLARAASRSARTPNPGRRGGARPLVTSIQTSAGNAE